FYVNDVKVSAEEAHAIPANEIATVNVVKGTGNVSSIRIRTVAATANGMKYRTGGSPSAADSAALRISGGPASIEVGKATLGSAALHQRISLSGGGFSGIVLINGVRSDAAALHKLDPRTIAGVEVIKGAAASAISTDPAAKNGIIKVTLK